MKINQFTIFQAFLAIYRKTDAKEYQRILHFPDIDWCKIVNGFKSLPLFDIMLNDFNKHRESGLGVCSRTGEMRVSNFSFTSSSLASKFPSGNYQGNFKLFDDVDENIFNITLFLYITS